jgi:hypothetical protein
LFTAGGLHADPVQRCGVNTCRRLPANMNKLYVGFSKEIELPKGSFLFIDDEVREHPKAKVFDPLKHSFNPLRHLDKKKARALADVLYTVSPQGENTLTVRNGRRALAEALTGAKRLDNVQVRSNVKGVKEEVEGMIDELLFTDVMREVLCSENDFAFTGKNTKVFARVNRAELGEFDALVLGLFLMAHFKGQIIVPDFGFYGRDAHVSLIREGRLIAGVNTLAELSPRLRQAVLLIKCKEASGATVDDAEVLAAYARLTRGTNAFNEFVQDAIA